MERLAPGLTLSDRFILEAELGRGAIGAVWRAEDQQRDERVALKILAADLLVSADAVALLREEYRKVTQLNHPNIVRVHEFYETVDICFISMQYIDGSTLGRLALGSLPEIIECALSLCDAIDYAHRCGIIHRDIKPANVLRDLAGRYYLTDFGIASVVSGGAPKIGQVLNIRGGGTLPSMSPQQLDGAPASTADDIYAFGALLYELLSGAPLFHPQPTPQRVREEQPGPLTTGPSGGEIPRTLATLVLAMLNKRPDHRPAGIAAVRSVLEENLIDASGAREADEVASVDEPGESGEAVIQPRRRPGSGHSSNGAIPNSAAAPPLRRIQSEARGLSPRLLAALGALVLITLGVVFVLPSVVEERGALVSRPDTPPQPEAPAKIDDADAPVSIDPAILAAQRARADEVLGEVLALQERLRTIGVERWGGEDWMEAGRLAEVGDSAYRERDFVAALSSHRQALDRMRLLESRAPEVFTRALLDGNAALLASDQNAAIQQFEIALSIQPNQADAQHGLQRALRLDRVVDFMNQAEAAERDGDWQNALSFYRQALELDEQWRPATEGINRSRAAIARAGYETQMAAGFSAVQREDFARARRAFRAALKIKPDDSAALEALGQIDADVQLQKIVALRLDGRAAEREERWPEAVRSYTEILAIDAGIEAVNRDLRRARQRARLSDDLDRATATSDQFYEDKVAQQADAVLARAQQVSNPGPKLVAQIAKLDQLLQSAATPVAVSFESDNLTDVVIYKVGRLGIFTARTIDLKPGTYVAVGTRDGYRDVRRNFRVVSDGSMPSIVLICEEPI